MGHMTITTPLSGMRFVIGGLGLTMIKLCTKFQIATLTHY